MLRLKSNVNTAVLIDYGFKSEGSSYIYYPNEELEDELYIIIYGCENNNVYLNSFLDSSRNDKDYEKIIDKLYDLISDGLLERV